MGAHYMHRQHSNITLSVTNNIPRFCDHSEMADYQLKTTTVEAFYMGVGSG